MRTLESLLDEGASVAVEGWDFSWFAGSAPRATEERPPWGYARQLAGRYAAARAALDVQTGGGEVVREALTAAQRVPAVLAVTESWAPNAALARDALAPWRAEVAEVPDDAPLPFPDGRFDLVTSRHPARVNWPELARVLAPGGTYFAQHVGVGTAAALTDYMMGPQPHGDARSPARAAADAASCGLRLVDLREATLRLEFFDVAAVAVYLRKVIWIVPGFTVEGYRDKLAELHERIRQQGPFVAHTTRYLIECSRPVAPL
ncbi:methyltransferase domain-containing protein [Dactylosporangium sp. NPDC005572]|uniref:methyltransferase domain-containing protein n=1 Tax=Dactylosporangium sp. NPDC005572 TaxID=3156889 RepID=UPI0033B52362